jgi:hypothetical protein
MQVKTPAGVPRPAAEQRSLALAFCMECLGWPDPSAVSRLQSFYIMENKRRPELSHVSGKIHGFHFDPGDLGHCINAVKNWCDSQASSLSLKYSPSASTEDLWRVGLAPHAEAKGDDPCDALLRACLAADRNIRLRNGTRMEIDTIPEKHNPAILADPWGDIRENAPTALAFCKECLGWKNAKLSNDWGYIFIRERVPQHLSHRASPPWERSFHFNENHVDCVVAAVRIWCDANAVGFYLEYFPSGSANDCWRASFSPDGSGQGDSASAALMSACVTARRKAALAENPACISLERR